MRVVVTAALVLLVVTVDAQRARAPRRRSPAPRARVSAPARVAVDPVAAGVDGWTAALDACESHGGLAVLRAGERPGTFTGIACATAAAGE